MNLHSRHGHRLLRLINTAIRGGQRRISKPIDIMRDGTQFQPKVNDLDSAATMARTFRSGAVLNVRTGCQKAENRSIQLKRDSIPKKLAMNFISLSTGVLLWKIRNTSYLGFHSLRCLYDTRSQPTCFLVFMKPGAASAGSLESVSESPAHRGLMEGISTLRYRLSPIIASGVARSMSV